MPRLRLPDGLDGPPFALPPLLDRLSERWWRLSPRSRAAALLTGVAAFVLLAVSHVAATPYGPPGSVLVATRDLPAGHELTDGDLRRETWPEDLVPAGTLTSADGRLGSALPRGTVATTAHVAEEGIAAGLSDGRAAVAVPAELLPALGVGNRVALVGRDLDGRASVLTTDGQVLAVDEVDAWFSVPADHAPQVAAAAASGMVTVVLVP